MGVLLRCRDIAFASVVTYARAKAEVIGLHGDVGVAPRPERLVIPPPDSSWPGSPAA